MADESKCYHHEEKELVETNQIFNVEPDLQKPVVVAPQDGKCVGVSW